MKKISIIIPVYNAMTSGGGYINRCVDSVLHQKDFSVDDIEIILINDGSKDNSLEVLQEIANNNSDIVRLIDQENMGVARTRNKGMGLATGEYTTFLDQDDWIDDDFFATLYEVAHGSNADVVASGYRRPNKDGAVVRIFHMSHSEYSRYTISAAWAKLHKTRFIQDNTIEFFDNDYGEDLPFSVKENVMAQNYQTVDYVGYNWFFNERSISNTDQKELTDDKIKSIGRLLSALCSIKPEKNIRDYHYFLLRTAVFYILFSGRSSRYSVFISAKQQLFEVLREKHEPFEQKNIYKLLFPPKGESLSVGFIVGTFIVLERLHLLPLFARLWCKPPKSSAK